MVYLTLGWSRLEPNPGMVHVDHPRIRLQILYTLTKGAAVVHFMNAKSPIIGQHFLNATSPIGQKNQTKKSTERNRNQTFSDQQETWHSRNADQ